MCIICQESSSETVQKLTRQGHPTLLGAVSLKFDEISNLLKKEITNEDNFMARNPVYHARCQRKYTIQYYKSEENVDSVERKENPSRRSQKQHELKNLCFICEKDRDSKGNRKLVLVSSFSRQNEIWKKAKNLHDVKMLAKIEGFGDCCIDMIAKDFKYHYICITRYLNKKVDNTMTSITSTNLYPFNELHNMLFVEGKGVTITWIRKKIHENALLHNISYDSKYPRSANIEEALKTKFSEKIVVLERQVVFSVSSIFLKMQKYIVNEDEDQSDNSEDEGTADLEFQEPILDSFNFQHETLSNICHTASVIRRDIIHKKKLVSMTLTISKEETIDLIPFRLFNFIYFLLHGNENEFDNEGRVVINKESERNLVISLCQDILYFCGIKTPKSIGLALLLLKERLVYNN